ncbi:hypothetical protein LC653_14510 [Nostoc sp. CHAB 5784]|nr:hypothetical protein [Nostoc mirabile]MCC5665095.1 hypothetical protein [Nostoc mirabile CHAB5784]
MSTTGYAYAPMTMEMLSAIAKGLEGCCSNTDAPSVDRYFVLATFV